MALQDMILENTKYTRATLELVLNKEKDKLTKHINETHIPINFIKLGDEINTNLSEYGKLVHNGITFVLGMEIGILWEKLRHRPTYLEGLFLNDNYESVSEVAGMFGYDLGTNPMRYTDTHNYLTFKLREK